MNNKLLLSLLIIMFTIPAFVSAGFFSDVSSTVTGNALLEEETCVDSDEGKDFDIKGVLNGAEDYCMISIGIGETYDTGSDNFEFVGVNMEDDQVTLKINGKTFSLGTEDEFNVGEKSFKIFEVFTYNTPSPGAHIRIISDYGNQVMEYYCDEEDQAQIVSYNCEYLCSQGACISPPEPPEEPECEDSDGGINFKIRGETEGEEDFCTISLGVGETFNDGEMVVEVIGANVEDEKITLKINGKSYDLHTDDEFEFSGEIYRIYEVFTYNIPTPGAHVRIIAEPGNEVMEYYCGENGEVEKTSTECEYGCKKGVCLNAPKIPVDLPIGDVVKNTDLKYYPKFFTVDNFNVVVGESAPASTVVNAINIIQGLSWVPKLYAGSAKLDSEVDNPKKINLISVGGACANGVTSDLESYPEECANGLEEGKGMVALYNYGGFVQLVVSGFSEEDEANAAQVLVNHQDYNLYGQKMIVEKKNGRITVRPEKAGEFDEKKPVVVQEKEEVEDIKIIEKPKEIEEEKPEEPIPSLPELVCSGCKKNDICYPFGTRMIDGENSVYCNLDSGFILQKTAEGECQNFYECKSNVCVDNQCVSGGFIQRLLKWLSQIFS